jgi:hypothetical protein
MIPQRPEYLGRLTRFDKEIQRIRHKQPRLKLDFEEYNIMFFASKYLDEIDIGVKTAVR